MKNDQLIEILGSTSWFSTDTSVLIKFIRLTLKSRKYTLSMDAYDEYNELLPYAIDTLCRVIDENQKAINNHVDEAIKYVLDMEEREAKKEKKKEV